MTVADLILEIESLRGALVNRVLECGARDREDATTLSVWGSHMFGELEHRWCDALHQLQATLDREGWPDPGSDEWLLAKISLLPWWKSLPIAQKSMTDLPDLLYLLQDRAGISRADILRQAQLTDDELDGMLYRCEPTTGAFWRGIRWLTSWERPNVDFCTQAWVQKFAASAATNNWVVPCVF